MREQASHVQRIQKTLEAANLKLASALTDIMGQSGRAVLAALAAGETDPDRLHMLDLGATFYLELRRRVDARSHFAEVCLRGRRGVANGNVLRSVANGAQP